LVSKRVFEAEGVPRDGLLLELLPLLPPPPPQLRIAKELKPIKRVV